MCVCVFVNAYNNRTNILTGIKLFRFLTLLLSVWLSGFFFTGFSA